MAALRLIDVGEKACEHSPHNVNSRTRLDHSRGVSVKCTRLVESNALTVHCKDASQRHCFERDINISLFYR